MKPAPFELRHPQTIAEALGMLQAVGSDGQILAGGQSLLPLMRYRILQPSVLIDIKQVRELRQLTFDEELNIGAGVCHAEIEHLQSTRYPVFARLMREHAAEIAFPAIRHLGTVVGSVCHCDPKGDWPLLLLATGARIVLHSTRGVHDVSLADFIVGALETDKRSDELAVAVRVPTSALALECFGRAKLVRRAGEFADCSAIALKYSDRLSVWVGAGPGKPFELTGLEELLTHRESAQCSRRDIQEEVISELSVVWSNLTAVEQFRYAGAVVDALNRAGLRVGQ